VLVHQTKHLSCQQEDCHAQEQAHRGKARQENGRPAANRALLGQLRVDVPEQGVQPALELRQANDDADADYGSDEPIFDGGRARCILGKPNEDWVHVFVSLSLVT
jgi:hypothetical protein